MAMLLLSTRREQEGKVRVKNLHETNEERVHGGTVSAWNLFREEDFQSNVLWFNDNLVQPGVAIEPHKHEDIEEVYYILNGKGRMKIGVNEKDVVPGDAIYIPIQKEHSLSNTGLFPLRFICVGAKIDKK
jgi:mannose-6-phosphate isomerase-like protein (cupin superfamily)